MNKKNISFIIGMIMLGIMFAVLLVSFIYMPYDPEAINAADKFLKPSGDHFMGTDNYGRDIFARVLLGMRTTIKISGIAIIIGMVLGTLIGSVAGYVGGFIDEITMRVMDGLASIPAILLGMLFIGILGRGTWTVTAALGLAFIPSIARLVRGEFLNYKHRDYIKSAKLSGASHARIMFVHILPNMKNNILNTIAVGFNNAVLAEAGMSFMGIGVQPPTPSLGEMLSSAQSFWGSAPWYAIFPGLAIMYMVIALVMFSEGLKERE